ncbi:filamentous hemagglutinin N-terminal domain-containing protein [Marinobacterium sp. MBR-109]|jgi:filamentous hemagglutinin family protein|uniref:two-partner secretion domain-containing protein n=1 Tax=Marinobacterium sp. MBR-109 TaxID=3156462 RepID=UPI003391D9E1
MTKHNERVNTAPTFNPRLLSLAVASVCFSMQVQAAPAVDELPSGAVIRQGQAVITQADNVMNIQQNSSRLVTDWNTFNIGSDAIVNFLQQRSDLALNRVLSGDPSQILGQINAQGGVIIANPAGVLFGSSARIDVGSLGVLGQMPDSEEFINGSLLLEDLAAGGNVINQGQITTRTGGFVVLAGKTVENSGTITAEAGQVALLAGDNARLELTADGLIGVEMDGVSAEAAIANSGAIVADGGKVLIQSRHAGGALSAAINQTGIVRANTLAMAGDGTIRIDAGEGAAMIAGTVEAKGDNAGEAGGRILVTGADVEITGSLNADGQAGGGTIHVGGGWQGDQTEIAEAGRVTVAQSADISADATTDGDGGEVVLWSADQTRHDGAISATGAGEGRGGDVETSSRGALGVSGSVDVSAESGEGGNWLLDPTNLTVNTAGGTADTVSNTSIESSLNGGASVTLQADQDISIEASIAKTTGAAATLTFDAGNDIVLHTGVDITSSGVGNQLNLIFGTAPSDTGTISIFGQLATNGGDVTFNKETYLRHETPVSTKVTQSVGAGVPSGDVLFAKDVYLADDGYSVTINTQGSDSGGVYNNVGGNIQFDGQVLSAAPVISSTDTTLQTQSPQNLTLDTTGLTGVGVTAGKIIFNADIGSVADPLRSLTFNGATDIDFNASTLNLSNTSGPVITASTNFADKPVLNLLSSNATINITGGAVPGLTAGYTSYLQDSFDIHAAFAGEQTLTINSDQSIKLSGVSIDADNTGIFNLLFNPNVATGSGQGAVVMSNVNISTEGGDISLGSAGNYAEGVAGDTDGSDGIRLHNTRMETAGGDLSIYGRTADSTQASDTSGAGVRITGAATYLGTETGQLSVRGQVLNQTDSGNKDAIIIGEGVSGTASLVTTSGNILIDGDASAVGDSVTGGNRYIGVLLANSALVQSDSGDIVVRGQGGGGNQNSVEQNHGIRLQGNGTSILSSSGDILLHGTSGGRLDDAGENSFGIYATGNSIYVGRDATKSAATGDIIFVADSMEFVNSSSSRLQVSSDGHLVIRPENADTKIEFGNAGSRPENDVNRTLYLGEDWFNGSANSVFLSAPQVTASAGGLSSQQNLLINGNAGGNFKLNIGGLPTSDIVYSTDSSVLGANIQAAIQNLAGYEGTTVLNQGSGSYLVTFKDGSSAAVAMTELVTADTARTGFTDITIGRTDLSGNITVNAPTTFRDDLTLLAGVNNDAYAAKVVVNSALTLARQPNTSDAGSLTIITDNGLTTSEALVAKGVITADELRLQGAGDFVATAINRINTLAADVLGDLVLTSGQALGVGQISTTRVENYTSNMTTGEVAIVPAVTDTTVGLTANEIDLRVLSTTPGVIADITQNENIIANTVSVQVEDGTFLQSGSSIISAAGGTTADLYLSTGDGTAKLLNDNVIGTFAGAFTADSGLEFNNARALEIGRVTLAGKTADTASTLGLISQTPVNRDGIQAPDAQVVLKTAGALTQSADPAQSQINAGVLAADVTGGAILLNNETNQIDLAALALNTADFDITLLNAGDLTIGEVTGIDAGLIAAGSVTGVTPGANGNIRITTGNGSLTVDKSVTATGTGTVDLRAGGVGSDLVIDQSAPETALITSETGAIQLLAGGSITTTKATDGTALIRSTGSTALLQAGDAIGSDGNRIEVSVPATFAAEAGAGGIWLRHLDSTALVLGDATALNTAETFGGTVSETGGFMSGLTTLPSSGGSITLTKVNGDIQVVDTIVADGSGYVDLRTDGTGAIRIDGGSIASDTGTLQLLSAGAISTNTTTGTTTELTTSGDVLLVASDGAIGSLNNRIEIAGATGVATQSSSATGSQFLSHTGDMTVAAVDVVNANTLDTAASLLALPTSYFGLVAGASQVIDVLVTGALQLNEQVQVAGGIIKLNADSVSQNTDAGKAMTAGALKVQATHNIALNNPENAIGTLAADSVNGTISYVDSDGLTVGTVDGLSGMNAAGNIDVQTLGGDLIVDQAIGTDTGNIDLRALTSGALTTNAAVVAGADGNVDLRTTNGAITLNANVTASGTGWVDARAGGATSDLTVGNLNTDYAQISSGTGNIQLLAGRDLLTTRATDDAGRATIITNDGSVLLQAAGNIGSDSNRIEIDGAAALAANADSGSLWLRKLGAADALQLGGVEAFVTDDLDDVAAGGSYNVSYAGLTTGGAGNITLTTQGGDLTLIENVAADTAGYVDLRTAGTGAVALNSGAQITSGTGTVQLLAGGAISTDSTTGTTTEVITDGDVLLQSGADIGSLSNRIELANVDQLAADSTGSQYFAHSGVMTVDQVAAVNTANSTDHAAADLNGLTAGDDQRIDLVAVDALQLNDRVEITGTTGLIRFLADSIDQVLTTGKAMSAGFLRADATNNIALNNPENAIGTLAADSVNGTISYVDSDGLTVGTVDGLSGMNAAGNIDVQTLGGDLIVAQAIGTDTGNIDLRALNNGALTTDAAVVAGADGNVDLRTTNGAITLNANVTASGDGWVDVRSGGVSDLTIGAATLVSSATGDIQLLSGNDLISGKVTNGVASISTNDGSVLLQAAGNIGSDSNRIEIDGASALAANADSGSLWLRKLGAADALQLGGVEAFVTDDLGDVAAGGSYDVSYAGLTTGNAGNITLTTQGGDLTLIENVAADTAGYVDLRTGGTGAVALNSGAQITSGTGTIQLLAGGVISTDSTTGTTTELSTGGDVLLQSGADIGSLSNRIELASVVNVAADSTGSQYLAHSGVMTVDQVAAVNTANSTDHATADLNGLTAGDDQRIDLVAVDALQLNDRVEITGTIGVIRFLADSIDQVLTTGKAMSAGFLRADATNNIALNNPENAIDTLAVDSAAGTISYVDSDGLTVGTVDTLTGMNAAGDIDVQTLGGDLVVAQAIGTDTGNIDLRALNSGALTTNAAVVAGTDGNVDLRTTDGAIALNANVTASGAGWVDVRSGNADLTIGAAALVSSTTGDIQLLSGNNLISAAATNNSASIRTDGSVLLQAAGNIGSDSNRIEIGGASALAANADSGSLWLRKLGAADALQLGGVEAFNTSDNTGGAFAVSYAGLTTGNAGNITLTTQGGDLTLVENVAADTAGYVDLRTGGTGAVALNNGAQITSGTGTVQLLASGAISTDSTTGTTTELSTGGDVLLQSGAAIGSLSNRIELANVDQLAANSTGSQYLAHSGVMTVDQVAALNTANSTDRAAAGLSGLTAGNNQTIDLVAADALQLNDRVQISGTTGLIRFLADSIGQVLTSGKAMSAGFLRADATNNIALNNPENAIGTLAADSTAGTLSYVDSNGLTVGTVDGLSGLNAAGNIDVQTLGGDLIVAQMVGSDSGNLALAADSGLLQLDADLATFDTAAVMITAAQLLQAAGTSIDTGTLVAGTTGAITMGGDNTVDSITLSADGTLTHTGLLTVSNSAALNAGGQMALGDIAGATADLLAQAGGNITLQGLSELNTAWIRSGNDILLDRPMTVHANTANAATLAADGWFYNRTGAGSGAIVANNSNWLIYDRTSNDYTQRMAGLQPDYLVFGTLYNNMPVDQVTRPGNGYYTGTTIVVPDNYLRVVSGTSTESSSGSGIPTQNPTEPVIAVSETEQIFPPALLNTEADVVYGESVISLAGQDGYALLTTGPATGGSLSIEMPMISLNTEEAFRVPLAELVGDSELVSVTFEGGALPEWLELVGNGLSARLSGIIPYGTEPFVIEVLTRQPVTGELQALKLLITPVDPESEQDENTQESIRA